MATRVTMMPPTVVGRTCFAQNAPPVRAEEKGQEEMRTTRITINNLTLQANPGGGVLFNARWQCRTLGGCGEIQRAELRRLRDWINKVLDEDDKQGYIQWCESKGRNRL